MINRRGDESLECNRPGMRLHWSTQLHVDVHLATYLLFMYCASRSALPLTPETPENIKQQSLVYTSYLIQRSVMQAYRITNSPTHSLPAKSTNCSLVQKFDFFDPDTMMLDAEVEYVGSWDREKGSLGLGRRIGLVGEAWQGKVYPLQWMASKHIVSASLTSSHSQAL